jgi:hypothetical protein
MRTWFFFQFGDIKNLLIFFPKKISKMSWIYILKKIKILLIL